MSIRHHKNKHTYCHAEMVVIEKAQKAWVRSYGSVNSPLSTVNNSAYVRFQLNQLAFGCWGTLRSSAWRFRQWFQTEMDCLKDPFFILEMILSLKNKYKGHPLRLRLLSKAEWIVLRFLETRGKGI